MNYDEKQPRQVGPDTEDAILLGWRIVVGILIGTGLWEFQIEDRLTFGPR